MSYNIYVVPRVEKKLKRLAKRYMHFKEGFEQYLNAIEREPTYGFNLGSNCYKSLVNVKTKERGKVGVAIAITYVDAENKSVYLLMLKEKYNSKNINLNEFLAMVYALEL